MQRVRPNASRALSASTTCSIAPVKVYGALSTCYRWGGRGVMMRVMLYSNYITRMINGKRAVTYSCRVIFTDHVCASCVGK
jgi:hypothetical protein